MPTRNDRKSAVTQFCLATEQHRRTDAGRVRTSVELLDHFFPRTGGKAEDRVFLHVPRDVRGPVISAWGIRGPKSANRDDDEKVRRVVDDALASGDIDDTMFETGLSAVILIDWLPLADWWTFWRGGKLTGVAIQSALATARELGLFDDKWFLENIAGRGGKTKGTDTVCDTLAKDQIVGWMRNIHASGDGSPRGLVAAIGWDTILQKTSQEALLFALDSLAKRIGLVKGALGSKAAMPPAGGMGTGNGGGGGPDVAIPDIPTDLPEPPSFVSQVEGNVAPTAGAASPDWPDLDEFGPTPSGRPGPAPAPVPNYGDDDEITSERQLPKATPPKK